jgi:pimeloyl-ACP methyl ester carboxylesterase
MMLILLLAVLGCGNHATLWEVAPGEELTVCTEGPASGAPVVLVPGLSGCAYGFRKVTPQLHDQGLRTIIIEPLGVGESSRPGGADYTMTAQAARIGAVLDSLSVVNAVCVGQGIGGAMIFRLAVARPKLLAGFVSIEGGAAETAVSDHTGSTLKLAKAVAKLGGKSILRDRFAENLKEGSGDPTWIDRLTVGRYFRGFGRDISATLNALTAMSEQAEPWAMTPRLPEIQIPVVVLLGTTPHAGEMAPQDVEILRDGLPNVTFREVPGAGHFIHEEQPQVVVDAVADLIAKLTAVGYRSAAGEPVSGDDGGTDLVQPGDGR